MNTHFTGTVYGEPELRHTPNGKAVLQLTVAESIGRDKPRNWYRVEVWEQMGENAAESLHDGSFVTVDARMRTETWDDKQTGEKRSKQIYTAEEIGHSLRFHTLTAQSTRGRQSAPQAAPSSTPQEAPSPHQGQESATRQAPATPQPAPAGWAPPTSTEPERPF